MHAFNNTFGQFNVALWNKDTLFNKKKNLDPKLLNSLIFKVRNTLKLKMLFAELYCRSHRRLWCRCGLNGVKRLVSLAVKPPGM